MILRAIESLATEMRQGFADVRQEFANVRSEMAQMRTELRQEIADTRHELTILIEGLRGEIRMVAEGLVLVNERVDRVVADVDELRG